MAARRPGYTVALVAGCSVVAAAPAHGQTAWFVDADAPGPASADGTIRVAQGTDTADEVDPDATRP